MIYAIVHTAHHTAVSPGLARAVVYAVLGLIGFHLLGGLFHHGRARRRAPYGHRVRLTYTLGRGWYGSVRAPGGFRIGHRL